MPVFHDVIYIEADPGRGWMYHVIGSHGLGWENEAKQRNKIEDSRQFYKKHLKGTVAQADLHRVDEICRSISMPQNLYKAGVEFRRDCRHWVRDALYRMEQQGVFKPNKER
ncbi:hypothetical protein PV11_05174 [Exophiala sideris]|uniref:PPPDE domain-containing protein n=1 Tax=Exophiala sideris TaxID=1016849 RepID=A0A0D1X5Z8_9EURO|nr:hypothetical protein PV11_05174 [Exophiala sideris]